MSTQPPAGPTGPPVERQRLRVVGVVQGVGFRPFVVQLASRLGLSGLVGNDGAGVFVEIEGPTDAVADFARLLVDERRVFLVVKPLVQPPPPRCRS